jgi:hypothetical protein
MSTAKANNELIIKTLTPLNGQAFIGREAIEDALFPHFGPLQPLFPGQGHRDLLDKLITVHWVIQEGQKFTVQLPTTKPATPANPEATIVVETLSEVPQTTPAPELPEITFDELSALASVGNGVQNPNVASLIEKGLVAVMISPLGEMVLSKVRTAKLKF